MRQYNTKIQTKLRVLGTILFWELRENKHNQF